jgi:hypothetical protein
MAPAHADTMAPDKASAPDKTPASIMETEHAD